VLSRSSGGETIATFSDFTAPGIHLDELRLKPIIEEKLQE